MQNIISIKNLRKEYKEFVLNNISLNIPRGNITGLIGPNGAGKTTTIKLILNLIQPDQGEIEIFGQNFAKNEIEIKNRLGYVGEEQYFYEHHSAVWTGKFVAHFYSDWNDNTFNELLDRFELPRKKWIKKYSKGMKVKLALALALAHDPELIILDEPTSGLDPIIRREVLDLLQQYTIEKQKSVVISSHITDDIARTADYITYMINGRIALFTEKDELLANWKKIHFKPDTLTESLESGLENLSKQMFGCSGITRNYQKIKDALAPGVSQGNIQIENADLDEILINLAQK